MTRYRALLEALAHPRLVGTPQHARSRTLLKQELTARGWIVLEHRFRAAPRVPLRGPPPCDGVNLIAVRPRVRVATWLVAHYDSKGQPFSMAGRLAWIGAALLAVPVVAVATLAGWVSAWWWAVTLAFPAGFLALNVATDRSPGAVDNASGVLTVLAILDRLPADTAVGAIFLDAEELGLAGARALARERSNLLADTAVINFDGIDDRGRPIAFVHRPGPITRTLAFRLGATPRRRLPVVVDGLALAPACRECLTIMKGDWRTMRVVHRPQDAAGRLQLTGAEEVVVAVAASLWPTVA